MRDNAFCYLFTTLFRVSTVVQMLREDPSPPLT